MSDAGPIWSLNSGALLWRRWDRVVMVYNDHSGATHELGELQAWVFERLAASPASLEQMTRDVSEIAENPEPDRVARALRETLALFDRLDLVHRPSVEP